MKQHKGSRTAEFMALFRALESQLPADKRLFNDPFAKYFLSTSHSAILRLGTIPALSGLLMGFIDRQWPGARTSGVARTRLIDDSVGNALANGIQQVVILGSGFDSRAYRLPGMAKLPVYEVDHPATSSLKRERIKRVLGTIRDNVHFVKIDFTKEDLENKMALVGYQREMTTIFVWEGVTNYLPAESVNSTLRWCSQAAFKSQVVFTYVDKKVLTDPGSFYGQKRVIKMLGDVGERWTFGINPVELNAYLRQKGLQLKSDIGAAQYRRLYYQEASSKMRGYEFYRVATATV